MDARKLAHEEIAAKRLNSTALATVARHPVLAILENIRSLYNVGSMFRTADGALLQRLLLTGYTPKPPRKEIEKTALGATSSVPWEYHPTPLDAVNRARTLGARICVLEHTTASIPYNTVRKNDFPLCLVVGNELTGVSPEIIRTADMAIDIPMYGTKQSLNAAVAFGIAVYELVRICRSGS